MSETLTLPVLPLDDSVVLPTMVVPLDTSDPEARASIEAARAAAAGDAKPQVLLVPRIGGRYPAVGTLGVVEEEGRLPNGKPGAVVRGGSRVTIGGFQGHHRGWHRRARGRALGARHDRCRAACHPAGCRAGS